MGLFIANMVCALFLGVWLTSIREKSKRGTNVVTRFVRNSSSFMGYNLVLFISTIVTCGTLILSLPLKAPLAVIPTMLIVLVTVLLKRSNTKEETREKDARVVTKGTLRAGGTAGALAATTAVTAATGGFAAPLVGIAAGGIVEGATQVAANNMCDVQVVKHPELPSSRIGEENFTKAVLCGLTKCSPEVFMATAGGLGIDVVDRSVTEVAHDVLQLASPSMLEELPDSMSDEDKAMTILGGYEGPCEDCGYDAKAELGME